LRLAIAAGCVTAALALAACGGDDDSGDSATPATTAKEVELRLLDFRFEPKTITGEAGQRLRIELRNEGKVEHNLSVDSQNVDQDVEPGEDARATVAIPESGKLAFYCSYHREQMKGTFAVGEAGGTATEDDSSGSGY
jgi:plastocyanin